MTIEHKYRTNIDIISLLVAWGLEQGSKEDVQQILKECVDDEKTFGLRLILECVRLGEGLMAPKGNWLKIRYQNSSLQNLFNGVSQLIWIKGNLKPILVGALKDYLCEWKLG